MDVDLMDSVWSVWLQTDGGTEQMAVLDYMGPGVLCTTRMVLSAAEVALLLSFPP